MSLTSEAYERRRWDGLQELQRLLTGAHGKPDYRSSASYREIDRISDLLHIFDLCDENLRGFSISDLEKYKNVYRELERLKEELRSIADSFQLISVEVENIARSIEHDSK